jgi:hypothetical protein
MPLQALLSLSDMVGLMWTDALFVDPEYEKLAGAKAGF